MPPEPGGPSHVDEAAERRDREDVNRLEIVERICEGVLCEDDFELQLSEELRHVWMPLIREFRGTKWGSDRECDYNQRIRVAWVRAASKVADGHPELWNEDWLRGSL